MLTGETYVREAHERCLFSMDAWDLGEQQEKLGVTSFEGVGSSQQDIKHLLNCVWAEFKLTLDRNGEKYDSEKYYAPTR